MKDRFSGRQVCVSSCLPVLFIGQLLICCTSLELPSRETKSIGSQGLQADLAWAASVSTCFPLLKVPRCIGSPSVRCRGHLSSFLQCWPQGVGQGALPIGFSFLSPHVPQLCARGPWGDFLATTLWGLSPSILHWCQLWARWHFSEGKEMQERTSCKHSEPRCRTH